MARKIITRKIHTGHSLEQQQEQQQVERESHSQLEDVITISDDEDNIPHQPEVDRQLRTSFQNSSQSDDVITISDDEEVDQESQVEPKSRREQEIEDLAELLGKYYDQHGGCPVQFENQRKRKITSEEKNAKRKRTRPSNEQDFENEVHSENEHDSENEDASENQEDDSENDDSENEADSENEDDSENECEVLLDSRYEPKPSEASIEIEGENGSVSPRYSKESEVLVYDDYEDYMRDQESKRIQREQESEQMGERRQCFSLSTSYSENEDEAFESFSQRLDARLFGNLEPESFESFCERLNIPICEGSNDVRSGAIHESEDDLGDDNIWTAEQW